MLDLVKKLVDFIVHIDRHLAEIIADYGVWTYAILFAVIFAETGLVVTPFLPGDSLLFAVGTLAAVDRSGVLQAPLASVTLGAAAARVPTANSSESPGRKGVTTSQIGRAHV